MGGWKVGGTEAGEGSSLARGPFRGGKGGARARPRPARPRRAFSVSGRGSGSTVSIGSCPGLPRAGPARPIDGQRAPGARGPPGPAMEGASFGAGRAGAALDPVSFALRPQTLLRVVSWVSAPHPPVPGLSRLTTLVLLPCPSPPSSSSPAPPPPAAGWGDVTRLGAPTCGRGRGRRRQPGTLRGHSARRSPSPIPP